MLDFTNPKTTILALARRCHQLRLSLGWSQLELAQRAGVAFSTLKRFEHSGQISLARLVMLAGALRALEGFDRLLLLPKAQTLAEIEERTQPRRRGRRRQP